MEMRNIDYKNIVKRFNINGNFIDAKPYGSGHINDTLLVRLEGNGKKHKYILRKINKYVFKNPAMIVENTVMVTNHIRKKLIENGEKNINGKVLTLIETVNGKYSYIDNRNEHWCLMVFIENAYTVDSVETVKQAYEAAKAYGKFQKYLSDFDVSKSHIIIKDFHNLTNRLNSFDEAIKKDSVKRVKKISKEIELVDKFRNIENDFVNLNAKNLPLRITHNDTKINNVMLSKKTDKGICVVDLDTVMPGIILNDFGDMVRTFTSPAAEDEKDTDKVFVRMDIYKEMVKGYLSEIKNFLTGGELDNLALGAKIIVYEQAIRFLTDYIEGDVYYKTRYENHNLVRAKNQFALLKSIEKNFSELQNIIKIFCEK